MKTFLDEEDAKVFKGISRSLGSVDDAWGVEPANGIEQVLQVLSEAPFEAIGTDMSVPGITCEKILCVDDDEKLF
jgi:hypothetical protein